MVNAHVEHGCSKFLVGELTWSVHPARMHDGEVDVSVSLCQLLCHHHLLPLGDKHVCMFVKVTNHAGYHNPDQLTALIIDLSEVSKAQE